MVAESCSLKGCSDKKHMAGVSLMIARMSASLSSEGLPGIVTALQSPEALKAIATEAKQFVKDSIAAVRAAIEADPNWTDEQICQMIMDGLAEKRKNSNG